MRRPLGRGSTRGPAAGARQAAATWITEKGPGDEPESPEACLRRISSAESKRLSGNLQAHLCLEIAPPFFSSRGRARRHGLDIARAIAKALATESVQTRAAWREPSMCPGGKGKGVVEAGLGKGLMELGRGSWHRAATRGKVAGAEGRWTRSRWCTRRWGGRSWRTDARDGRRRWRTVGGAGHTVARARRLEAQRAHRVLPSFHARPAQGGHLPAPDLRVLHKTITKLYTRCRRFCRRHTRPQEASAFCHRCPCHRRPRRRPRPRPFAVSLPPPPRRRPPQPPQPPQG